MLGEHPGHWNCGKMKRTATRRPAHACQAPGEAPVSEGSERAWHLFLP